MEKITDRFEVQTDNGQSFVILEYTKFIETPPSHNGSGKIFRGLKRLYTADGKAVNFEGNGLYEIVALGITARRTDK